MTDFPNGIPELPDINPADPPGSAAGGLGLRALINRANDNILALIDGSYNGQWKTDPIVNGGPLIWSDALSYPAIGNQVYGPDQWRWHTAGGAGVVTLAISVNTPAPSVNTEKIPYSLRVLVTTADVSLDPATDWYFLEHLTEGFLWSILAQREFTIRFWVKATLTGVYSVAFVNEGSDRTYIGTYTINAANTWEEKSITVPASPVAGTWNYELGTGLRIRFALAIGANQQDVAGSWLSALKMSTSAQPNVLGAVSNDFSICGLTARPGPYCGPYNSRPYAVEDLLCKRYFEVLGNNVNTAVGTGFCISTTAADFLVPFQRKRTTPTVTVDTIANLKVYTQAAATNCTALSIIGTSPIFPLVRATVAAGLTLGHSAILLAQTALVKINARLT